MLQDGIGEDDIERRVGEGEPANIAGLEGHIAGAAFRRQRTGALDLQGCEVDTDDLSGCDNPGQPERDRPWSRAR